MPRALHGGFWVVKRFQILGIAAYADTTRHLNTSDVQIGPIAIASQRPKQERRQMLPFRAFSGAGLRAGMLT